MKHALSVVLALVLAAGAMSPVGASTQVDDGCVQELAGWGSVQSSWTTGCMSYAYSERMERYARYFAFSLDRQTSVKIAVDPASATQRPHLFLYRGNDLRSVEQIDMTGWLFRRTLPAGDYLIEATTWYQWRTGAFTLAVTEDVDPVPAVTVSGGIGLYEVGHTTVTEGRSAVFTLSASPPPSAPLPVQVIVDQEGDFGVDMDLTDDSGGSYRAQTVIIPTSGRAALTVATVDDDVDEERGRVQVALRVRAGWDYQHGSSQDFVYVLDNDPPPPPQAGSEVSVAAGGDVSEGGDAVFTVTASPAPSQPLSVNLTVGQVGGFGASTGSQTVTVPTSGIATVNVATSDDDANEPDGSVSVTVDRGGGYSVSGTQGTASVAVADDDPPTGCRSVAALAAEARANHDALRDTAENRRQRNDWWRAWIALSGATGTHNTPLTAAEAREVEFGDARWTPFRTALECLEGTPSPAVPVVSAAAGSGVSEGGDAVFAVTANPAPSQPLTVNLTVGQWGQWGASTGSQTVTVPTSGIATVNVATSDDGADEPDGSVSVTVDSGGGYTVSSTEGTAVVDVADDDGSLPAAPQIRVTAGSEVTEGGGAVFTVTASPPPSQPLAVTVSVAQTGDFGATTGTRTVTVPTNGTATVTVSTSDDSADEPDGWVTVSARPGDGYTVASARGSASVDVTDDDDLPTPDVGCTEALAGSGTAQGSWDFWCRSQARSGRFARFFTFSLDSQAQVRIDLESKVDTYLYLRQGLDQQSASVVAEDDDGGAGFDSRIATTLDAGDYTIEATTYSTRRSGPFTLNVVGVPTQKPVEAGADDDEAPSAVDDDGVVCVVPSDGVTVGEVAGWRDAFPGDAGRVLRWDRVLAALGEPVEAAPMTVAESRANESVFGARWDRVTRTLEALGCGGLPPVVVPEVSVAAGGGVTEGADAVFTVSASPAPTAPLAVDVTVAQAGDFGAGTGARTVIVPVGGSVTVTVGTSDDESDESDGSVSVTVDAGDGYTVSAAQGSASVAVADDDDPPPVIPVVSISGATGGEEGQDVTFTLSASPAPSAPLAVSVTVAASGDFGVSAGSRTVTIPIGGSASLSLGTVDDGADEPDGSVSLSLNAGDGYTVGLLSAETASVLDNDDAPLVAEPEIGVTAGSAITEGADAVFTVTASPAPSAPLTVNVTVAQAGGYGAATGARTVTIPTSGSATLTVSTSDDGADEADGLVSVAVDAGGGYTVSGTQGSASVAVSDDDDPPPADLPEVSVADGSVVEGELGWLSLLEFSVTLSEVSAQDVTVRYVIRSGTAVGGLDYWGGAGQVTIWAGFRSATIGVNVKDDTRREPDETLTVELTDADGAVIADSAGAATGTIIDND